MTDQSEKEDKAKEVPKDPPKQESATGSDGPPPIGGDA